MAKNYDLKKNIKKQEKELEKYIIFNAKSDRDYFHTGSKHGTHDVSKARRFANKETAIRHMGGFYNSIAKVSDYMEIYFYFWGYDGEINLRVSITHKTGDNQKATDIETAKVNFQKNQENRIAEMENEIANMRSEILKTQRA